jgi:hypothetical protein
MTEQQWLTSADVMGLANFGLSVTGRNVKRTFRLFCCACHRRFHSEGLLSGGYLDVEARHGAWDNWDKSPIALARSWVRRGQNSLGVGDTRATQKMAVIMRDIIGNPWRRVEVGRWRTPDVVGIAQEIRDGRRYELCGHLADALVDAGCDCEALIDHLRGTVKEYNDGGVAYWHTDVSGPQLTPELARAAHVHVLGCWAIDLVLYKG